MFAQHMITIVLQSCNSLKTHAKIFRGKNPFGLKGG